ncbi:hypothetical protein FQZ97_739740 [compost metagenome]
MAQRDIHVTRRLALAAHLRVGAGGEQEVAIESAGIHAHAVISVVQTHGGPLGTRLQAPADMGNAIDLGVVEILHVVAQVLGLEAAVDTGDEAFLDFQGDALAAVSLERQQDVADVQHQGAFGALLVRPGEKKAARPVVPAPRFVRIAVLGDGRVLA